LPSVDKDTSTFVSGQNQKFAFVQTSITMYIFVPIPYAGESPKVDFTISEYGTEISLRMDDEDVIVGTLAHPVKPGTEIWMIEEAADGTEYIVIEMDKETEGREWLSMLKPEVVFSGDYSHLKVEEVSASQEHREELIQETLTMLQKRHAMAPRPADQGHEAKDGDVLTVDMQGFQMLPSGNRGDPMDIGSASDMKVELGNPKGGLTKQIREALVGIKKGETRDVEVTLGRNAGAMAGYPILSAVTCKEIEVQVLPEMNDDLAKKIKQGELWALAGTEEGIPEEEEDIIEAFTLKDLQEEVRNEIHLEADKAAYENMRTQLENGILTSAEVQSPDFAHIKDADLHREEKLHVIIEALAAKENIPPLDDDEVKKRTWNKLGTPKPGSTVAEVGADPAREFEDANHDIIKIMRKDQILDWLGERAEVVNPEEVLEPMAA